MSVHGRTEMQVKQYIRQFHSVHLADIMAAVEACEAYVSDELHFHKSHSDDLNNQAYCVNISSDYSIH